MTQMISRSYNELRKLETFEDRFDYLILRGNVGTSTFGYDRYLNQMLYKSREWRRIRDLIIVRDEGCDLGIKDHSIVEKIIIHHINPITIEDIEHANDIVFDPNNLICTAPKTHLAIHYGDESLLPKAPINRRPGDTIPWR